MNSGAERLLEVQRNWVANDATGFGAMVLETVGAEAVGQETTGLETTGTDSRRPEGIGADSTGASRGHGRCCCGGGGEAVGVRREAKRVPRFTGM